jgi:hypothetical protein
MTDRDPVFARLAALAALEPSPEFSERLRGIAHGRLRSRPVHPAWLVLVAVSLVGYLGWAAHFAASLYAT